MANITANGQRILKILHLLAVSFWVGGALSLMLLYYASAYAESDGEMFGLLRGGRFIDMYVVVYLGAFGSFFTGLAYSLCTRRGFARHKWVVAKWLATIILIICGGWVLGPWSAAILEKVQSLGLAALADPVYISLRGKMMYFQVAYLAIFVALFALSVYKPGETRESLKQLERRLRGRPE